MLVRAFFPPAYRDIILLRNIRTYVPSCSVSIVPVCVISFSLPKDVNLLFHVTNYTHNPLRCSVVCQACYVRDYLSLAISVQTNELRNFSTVSFSAFPFPLIVSLCRVHKFSTTLCTVTVCICFSPTATDASVEKARVLTSI
jgi:hypothetical protein